MATYLQMDGVDDVLRTAAGVNFDKIILDIEVSNVQSGTYRAILENSDAASNTLLIGAFNANATYSGANMQVGTGWSSYKVDGVVTKAYLTNKRFTLELGTTVIPTELSNGMEIFAWKSGGGNLKGNIYDVKLYNAGSLVIHYDMNTGTVQDQSGNGRHAILTGGTWVSDAPTSTPESNTFSTRQTIYQSDSVTFPMVQNFIETFVADSFTFPTRQAIYSLDTQSFATRQVLFASDMQSFPYLLRIYSEDSTSFPMLQVIDVGLPTFESVSFPFRTFIHNMLVIEHDITGERFMFPRHNVNKETYEGFIQFQVVPRGFHLSEDQSPVPIIYMRDGATELVRWEANSKDPVNTMEKWKD